MWKKIKSIFGRTETDTQFQDNGIVETPNDVETIPVDNVAPENSDVEHPKEEIKVEKPHYSLSIADAVAGIIYDLGRDFITSAQSINAMADYGAFQNQRASATEPDGRRTTKNL